MAVYYVVALGVQETDLTRMYSIMIALLIAYNRVANKSEGNKAGNEIKAVSYTHLDVYKRQSLSALCVGRDIDEELSGIVGKIYE